MLKNFRISIPNFFGKNLIDAFLCNKKIISKIIRAKKLKIFNDYMFYIS